jgi:DNA uptake protein ComE-like DNA-binding protein
MKFFTKTALIAVSLMLSANAGFAADVTAPALDLKGAAKSASDGVKADAKATSSAAKEDAKVKATDTKAAAKAKIVDINSASVSDLKAISGIGEAYASKIIAGRPYANKTQLKSRNILPPNVYEQVKDMIIAKLQKK